jgi:putative FmdB family regulatory protein
MPTYEYRCAKCGQQLEVFQSFSDAPLTKHEQCGGKLTKVLSAAGVILKGSGFYKTDNRSSGKPAKKSDDKDKSTTESKPSETKSSSDSGTSTSTSSGSSSSSGSSGSRQAGREVGLRLPLTR